MPNHTFLSLCTILLRKFKFLKQTIYLQKIKIILFCIPIITFLIEVIASLYRCFI
nr:MAG TPA: hypothetical protein [Caudoviricetes sp.]